MGKKLIEEIGNIITHNEPKKGISDAIEEHLDLSIERLDKMFLLICKIRACYIQAKKAYENEDYVDSHNKRAHANLQLKLLYALIKKNFIQEK